jgi:hypothetical protein
MTADVNINNDKQRKPEYNILLLEKRYANPQTKKRMYDDLQKIACVINAINTACDTPKQTQMAQEHAELILEHKQNTEKKTHKDFPVQKGPKYLSTGWTYCISE